MMKMSDAGFLLAERPTRGAQVSMLTTWSLPKGAKDNFLGKLVAHWRGCKRFTAPFNLRVKPGLVPEWETLAPEQIDLDYHLFHSGLPGPGGERELGVLASRLHSIPLDRSRPLWEMHVIEGLQDRQFALLLKLHHSQIDGMGAIRLLERVLSSNPDTRNMPAFWEVAPRTQSDTRKAPDRKVRMGDIAKLAWAYLDMRFGTDPDNAAPFDAPMTVLNGRIKAPRRVATQLYETARLARLAKEAGVTLNDVALNICAGALRRYLIERGELPKKTLTAGLPVSLRDDEGVGNAISFIIAKLHTGIADPVERLQAIHRSTSVAKDRFQALPSRLTREALGTLVMTPYIGQVAMNLGGRYTPVYNLVISNVPGPKDFLYLNGARMEAFYPISLIFDGQALNITFLSYAGRCAVGFTSCREAVPHMQRIAVASGEELNELEKALVERAPGRTIAAAASGRRMPKRSSVNVNAADEPAGRRSGRRGSHPRSTG